jgi:hypothetical protein
MQKITLTLLVIIATISSSFGQTQEAKTNSGKKVILNSDGTWKYIEENKITTDSSKKSDCSNFIQTIEDKMDGEKTTYSKNLISVPNFNENKKFVLSLSLGPNNEIIFLIIAVGAGCIEEKNKINILFTDGSRLQLFSNDEFNCKGETTLYFGGIFGRTKELQELKTKKIQTMRIATTDTYFEKDFTDENSNEFFQTINCLSKNN